MVWAGLGVGWVDERLGTVNSAVVLCKLDVHEVKERAECSEPD